MTKRAIVLLACVLCFAAGALAGVNVGDKPSLSFRAVGSGQPVSLSDYAGKIVVIDFWATWCGPCMGEADHMVAINGKYSPQGLVMIGISLDQDINQMQQVAAAKGFTWVQACDGQGWNSAFAQQFGVDGIPHTVLIGPDGTVLWEGHPAGGLDDALAAAFRDHPPVMIDPATATAAAADFDAVAKALDDDDFSTAAKAWAKVPSGIDKDKKLAARQSLLEQRLDIAAQKALAGIETLVDQKKYREAVSALRDMVAKLGSLPIAAKAQERLTALADDPEITKEIRAADRADRASAALAAAERYKAQHKDEQAYAAFKSLAASFADTPSGLTAAAEVAAYDKDQPGLGQRVAGDAADARAKSAFNMAQAYLEAGNDDMARKKFQEVIDKYPNTSWAAAARQKLAQ